MKKKRVTHKTRSVRATRVASRQKPQEGYLVVVRSWMLLVMFALMLGLGAVVGTYLNQQSAANEPAVAGAQVEAR